MKHSIHRPLKCTVHQLAVVQIFVEHWRGDNLQFYPNFALFSTLGDGPQLRFFSGEQIK